jgi:hypothetical protein
VKQKRAEIASTQAQTAETITETRNLGDQPIFAVDPNTSERVMTTRPEAQAKGYTNPVPVREGDVSKETDARAMINDVQLNKSRYLASMQRVYSEPMTNAQKTALVALTPERLGLDIGHVGSLSIGFSLPDVMQKVSNASAFSALSPAQKQAVIGYYSTLASVPAAQKALTNIGKSNKEMMDLELRTIPTPLMDAGSFGAMLDRFQGNVDQTSKKTVRIPGMPSTSDIRDTYEGSAEAARPGLLDSATLCAAPIAARGLAVMQFFCMVCREAMPDKRARQKKAYTCSDKCQAEYRKRMRQERAEQKCRLCGRRYRKSRSHGPVLMEHSSILEVPDLVAH